MTPDATLDREMAYTDWYSSCRAPVAPADDSPMAVVCRRANGHADDHAAGFGAARVRWANTDDPRPEFPVVPIVTRGGQS